jgi:hypothetical protein
MSRHTAGAPRSSFVLSRSLGFPNEMRARLRYSEFDTQLTPAASLPGRAIYSATGLYDPNYAVGGHQPMGFDQYMLAYQHYRVTGARISVTFHSETVSENYTVGVAVRRNPSIGTFEQEIEQGFIKHAPLSIETGSRQSRTISYYVNPQRWLGIPAGDADRLEGDASSNPTEQCYFQVLAMGVNTGVTAPSVRTVITIDYDVVFREKKLLSQS